MRHLHRLLRYDVWANRETLRSLKQRAPSRSLRWMGHIVGAEYLWLARLRRHDEILPVWPELDLEACGERIDELSRLWPEYLDDVHELADGILRCCIFFLSALRRKASARSATDKE